MADDIRGPDDEKSNQVTEQHLPQQRRPIECKERRDAAERKISPKQRLVQRRIRRKLSMLTVCCREHRSLSGSGNCKPQRSRMAAFK